MLVSLSITNFILIERLSIEFSAGLNVITGETGAGKSIILDALGGALGKRVSAALIKDSSKPAVLAAEFDISSEHAVQSLLTQYGISDTTLILRRVIDSSGKSRAFLNDVIVSAKQLQDIAAFLLEICGQHAQHGLLDAANHLAILDEYAGLHLLKKKLRTLFENFSAKKEDLAALSLASEKASEERANLEYILAELATLAFMPGENVALEERRKVLSSLNKAKEVAEVLAQQLSDDGQGLLKILYGLQKLCGKVPDHFSDISNQLSEAVLILEDVLRCSEAISCDGSTLEVVESRLFNIRGFARKYGITPLEIPAFAGNIKADFDSIINIDAALQQARTELAAAKENYFVAATAISQVRKSAAVKLREALLRELSDIKMSKTDFHALIEEKTEEKWSVDGIDIVKFLIKTNPGAEFGAIGNVASGGELSRIMLACKVVISALQDSLTVVFDEVDSGISGSVSSSIGRKLSELSKRKQVIVVTHHPQVAVFADHHYLISKSQGDEAVVQGHRLSHEQSVAEVARMLSGDQVTPEAIKAAESLFHAAL